MRYLIWQLILLECLRIFLFILPFPISPPAGSRLPRSHVRSPSLLVILLFLLVLRRLRSLSLTRTIRLGTLDDVLLDLEILARCWHILFVLSQLSHLLVLTRKHCFKLINLRLVVSKLLLVKDITHVRQLLMQFLVLLLFFYQKLEKLLLIHLINYFHLNKSAIYTVCSIIIY